MTTDNNIDSSLSLDHLPITRVVLFLDILGFQEKVDHMSDDPTLFMRVREMLDAKREEFQLRNQSNRYNYPEEDLEVTQFSDSLVYSFPLAIPGYDEMVAASVAAGNSAPFFRSSSVFNEDAASNAIGFASMVSAEWHALGFFVRGGIAYGWTYHKGSTVFGKGIIAAYQLESQVAKVPRIVVADEVVKLIADENSYVHNNLLGRDSDGCWFVRPFASFVRTAHELSRTDEVPARVSTDWDKVRENYPQDSEEDFQRRRENFQEREEDYQKARDRANENRATMMFKQFPQVGRHIQRELERAKDKGPDRVAKYRWLANQFNAAKEEIAQYIKISVDTIEVS